MTRDNAWRIGSLYALALMYWVTLAPVLTWKFAQLLHAVVATLAFLFLAYLVFRVTESPGQAPSTVRSRITQKREQNRAGQ